MRQGATQTFIADDLVHAQDLRRHCVTAQADDMSIAPLSIKNRKQPGTQYVANRRCIRTGVTHRTAFCPAIEESRDLKKLSKEAYLAQSRGAATFVPAHLEPASGCRNT